MIANWNGGHAGESLGFFAGRGHHQIIAGYYDQHDVTGGVKRWRESSANINGIDAWMYTTWHQDYSDLEKFAQEVRRQ